MQNIFIYNIKKKIKHFLNSLHVRGYDKHVDKNSRNYINQMLDKIKSMGILKTSLSNLTSYEEAEIKYVKRQKT